MRQKPEREAKLPVVMQRRHEPVVVSAHIEDGGGPLARHGDLIGVREDPAQGGEVRKLMGFHEPLPHSKGWRCVGILFRPLPER